MPLKPPKVSVVQLPAEGSCVKALQDRLGSSVRVVSAFQNVSAHALMESDKPVDCDVLVCADDPAAKVIILTTFDDDEYVFEGVRAGALGYMLKAASGEELADAVRTVAAGGALIEPSVARRVMAEFARISRPSPERVETLLEPLSEREVDILKLLALGLANREIADRLHLAEGTVKNYVSSLMQKLNVRDRTQAALRARELDLI